MNAALPSPSFRPSRRAFALAGALVLALATGGCIDSEPQQRRAFITFLKTRVIDKPGLHIPIMSDKDVTDFGPYADQYRIMNGFTTSWTHRFPRTLRVPCRSALLVRLKICEITVPFFRC
jgi:hypothetical protein